MYQHDLWYMSLCVDDRLVCIPDGHLHRVAHTRCLSDTIRSLGDRKKLSEICRGKGKSVPLQTCSGPEGSRKFSFPHFITKAQDGGKFVSLRHRPPLPQ